MEACALGVHWLLPRDTGEAVPADQGRLALSNDSHHGAGYAPGLQGA